MTTHQFRPVGGGEGFSRRHMPVGGAESFQSATMSTTPYVPPADPRDGRCVGNDNTCGAFQAKGTAYCAGHLRGLAKAQANSKVTNESD